MCSNFCSFSLLLNYKKICVCKAATQFLATFVSGLLEKRHEIGFNSIFFCSRHSFSFCMLFLNLNVIVQKANTAKIITH